MLRAAGLGFVGQGPLRLVRLWALSILVLVLATTADAADLRIGLMNLARSRDPHSGAIRSEYQLLDHIYERMLHADPDLPVPKKAHGSSVMQADGRWVVRTGIRPSLDRLLLSPEISAGTAPR